MDGLLSTGATMEAMALVRRDGGPAALRLHDVREMIDARRAELGIPIDDGTIRTDLAEATAALDAITVPVAAVEALWDGDSIGWIVVLFAIVRRPGREHPAFDEMCLGAFRYGGDLRVLNGQVPPWPEAADARRIGTELADRLGVPFYFHSPDTPDTFLPRWWNQG
ncbi:hypothetical protein [Catellatospora sp. TT07R-123]|uniref:hypothetical protein n=1 Tax=Catellatospora sp. TT07R-123 TaxID=2733863 RepID=UPI001BB36DA4|nr:hypothetical protein [Catellatospora sp. TT07R-123]